MPESLNPTKYREFLNKVMLPKPQEIFPAVGTEDKDQLYPHLYEFCVNSTQAKTRAEIRGGLCWTENGYHYFYFSSFFETLPTRWKVSPKDTGIILKKDYEAEFSHSFNIKTGIIRCVRLKQLRIDQIEYQPTDKKEDDY
jgi:hypothetical protein